MATNPVPSGVATIGDIAQSSGVREALQWFTREKQWINEQHLELCRIPSPTFIEHEGEGNLSGMRHICRQSPLARRIASFLVLDGASTEHITSQALGSRRFELTFSGPGGHSWSDYGTGNPVHALSRAVSLFADTRLNGPPRAAFNIGVIEGGASINSIPTLAKAKIDIRSESNDKMAELVDLLAAAVERAQSVENERATAGKVAAKLKEIGSRPAGKLAEGAS